MTMPKLSEPGDVRLGTMGWSYPDWRGPFYPKDLPTARMLEIYASVFPQGTVELDTTFYGVPLPSTIEGWASQVPSTFLFSAKVPRAITHERRLHGAAEAALDFGTLMREKLGPRLGGLLVQLPPDFTDSERATLDTFVDGITSPRGTPGLPWVIEFRNVSWAGIGVAEEMEACGIACATTERLDVGGRLSYIRLLGTENAVRQFDATVFDRTEEISSWAKRIADARAGDARAAVGGPPILIYARNFFEGHAPETLFKLRACLGLPVPIPPGKQQLPLF